MLWDTAELTNERAVLYAAPVWRVMADELGDGRIPELEVWHLRSGVQHVIDATTTAAAMPDVARVVHRLSRSAPRGRVALTPTLRPPDRSTASSRVGVGRRRALLLSRAGAIGAAPPPHLPAG